MFPICSYLHHFFSRLSICTVLSQGDLGGERTLQKKWTSFLKAKLVCSMPELNFVFNVVQDIFTLKGAEWKDTVFYGVFTSQWSVFFKAAERCTLLKKSFMLFFSPNQYQTPSLLSSLKGECGFVSCVRLQRVGCGGSLLQGEVYAEGHSGTVAHQVGAIQRRHTVSTPRSSK